MRSTIMGFRVTEAELKEIQRLNANENLSQKIRDFLLNGKSEPKYCSEIRALKNREPIATITT